MIGKQLFCNREVSNAQDEYMVAVMHGATVFSHVPRKYQQPLFTLQVSKYINKHGAPGWRNATISEPRN